LQRLFPFDDVLVHSVRVGTRQPIYNVLSRLQSSTAGQCTRTCPGSRTFRPQYISAPRHFGTNFKPNHRWSCVLSELSWVQSVPTFRRSEAEVSRTTFLAQKCVEKVLKCFMRRFGVACPYLLFGMKSPLSKNRGNAAGQYNKSLLLRCSARKETIVHGAGLPSVVPQQTSRQTDSILITPSKAVMTAVPTDRRHNSTLTSIELGEFA